MAKMKKRHYEGGRSMYEPDERGMEKRDGGMLHADHKAIANLPQDVKYHAWANDRAYLNTHLDDTIDGIKKQQKADVDMANRHAADWMY